MSNTLCIYHGNCADGFAAAWVVRKFYKEVYSRNDIEFHAGVYQNPPPEVKGKNVILVDFSYKRPILDKMKQEANSILILDHHKTAMENLQEFEGAIFDMNRSGAMITWNHFFANQEAPQLIEHIQDRDLWQFKLPGTREIQAAVFSYPYDFEVWDELMKTDPLQLFTEGTAIERKHFKDINELLAVCKTRTIIAGYDVPIANLPYIFSSDAGHIMGVGEPFAACYMDTPEGRVYSLRSSEVGGVDVGEVAKLFGGGGHKHAAGFRIPYNQIQELEKA